MSKTALLIVNYKTPWHLNECLSSIYTHTRDFHIVVVHNSIDPKSVEVTDRFVKMYPGTITVLKSSKNLGFVGGVNYGFDEVMKYERMCFVNSDIIVTKDWLKVLNEEMDSREDIVQISPDCSQFYPEGKIWRVIKWQIMRRFPTLGSRLYKLQLNFNPPRSKERKGFSPIPHFHMFPGGYCNLVKTAPFKTLGYILDPNIIHGYWDDFDVSLYLRQFGQVGSTTRSYVFHFENISFDKISEERKGMKNRLMMLNGLYVADKWRDYIRAEIKKLSFDELLNLESSYVFKMIYTYEGLASTKPEILDYIRSIPAKEIGVRFLN